MRPADSKITRGFPALLEGRERWQPGRKRTDLVRKLYRNNTITLPTLIKFSKITRYYHNNNMRNVGNGPVDV